MNTVIVDDESLYIELLSRKLHQVAPDVTIVATFNKPIDALVYLRQNQVDLIFLDVEMPDIDGFKFLDLFRPNDTPVIFVTSHEGYALKAFRYAAVDYLLKPVHSNELSEAINKINRTRKEDLSWQMEVLRSAMKEIQSENSRFNRLVLNTQDKVVVLDIDEIVNIEASGPYSLFYTIDKKQYMTSKPLAHYEDLLRNNNFYRLHRSHLINLLHVNSIMKEDGVVLMRSGTQLPFAKDNITKLLENLK
jgi:two-component system LytT family response regulator